MSNLGVQLAYSEDTAVGCYATAGRRLHRNGNRVATPANGTVRRAHVECRCLERRIGKCVTNAAIERLGVGSLSIGGSANVVAAANNRTTVLDAPQKWTDTERRDGGSANVVAAVKMFSLVLSYLALRFSLVKEEIARCHSGCRHRGLLCYGGENNETSCVASYEALC